MDESTLNKPVNLQNLSLALAKTRSVISEEISNRIDRMPFPNWYAQKFTDEEDNITYDSGYIANKPPVMGDVGQNSVNLNSTIIGAGYATGDYSTHIGSNSMYINGSIKVTGEPNSTIYTYNGGNVTYATETLDKFLESSSFNGSIKIYVGLRSADNPLVSIVSADVTQHIIVVEETLSTTALSNQSCGLMFISNASGESSLSLSGGNASGSGAIASMGSSASGNHSVALGRRTVASSGYTAAFGDKCVASGVASVAFGQLGLATGNFSFVAGGSYNEAKGLGSHAEGKYTIANGAWSHALGTYNIEDTGSSTHPAGASGYCQYAVILGNGVDSEHRSNAHTIDWTGKGWFANTVSAGTIETPAAVVNANDLTTKAYVDSAATSSLSLNGNVITLTNSNGTTSSITLPVYGGEVTEIWEGGSY